MARIEFDEADLRPLVEVVVKAVVAELEVRYRDRLSRAEAQASRLLTAPQMQLQSERLSYAEVAAILGVKPQTVRRWVAEGRMNFPTGFKLGKYRSFLRSDIEAWIESRRNAY